jgi:multidrug resistance efflux pump
VITENLDRFENKHLSAGEPLLEIVNLTQLTASVKFRQEDADLIEPGAKVRFRPREAVLRDYTATVQEISPVVETDQSQQQRNLTVKIIIDNDDSRLRPGVVGDARLETEPMPIYQNVQREFLKVVPVGKWF